MSNAPPVSDWTKAESPRTSAVSMPTRREPPGSSRPIRLVSLDGSKRLKSRSRRSISSKAARAACPA